MGEIRVVPAHVLHGPELLIGFIVVIIQGLSVRRSVRTGGEAHTPIQPKHCRGGRHRIGHHRCSKQLFWIGSLRRHGIIEYDSVVFLAWHDISQV